jgi:DNA-binding MarR family transcriptional regulator
MPKQSKLSRSPVKDSDFRALADFRYHIRRYLDLSDRAAMTSGVEPKQYQLLLAIRGLPPNIEPNVGAIAQSLHTRHNSTVELLNRAERNNFVTRERVGGRVFVRLTAHGERFLQKIVAGRLRDLRAAGPDLVHTLNQLMQQNRGNRRTP